MSVHSRDPWSRFAERQLTSALHGHILTSANVWSPCGQWIVYDVRSDPAGSIFDGTRIEMVHVESGEVRLLYESRQGACCGVASFCPVSGQVVFIHGPENPTEDWQYSAWHRRGVVVGSGLSGSADLPLAERADHRGADNERAVRNLDARDLVPPFTRGALRGGTHLHLYSPDGQWIAFTYEDHLLATTTAAEADLNQRNVGVAVPGEVRVSREHPRNHDGSHFSVLVTRTENCPRPGSDEISRASEEAWIGQTGYRRADGTWQRRALAFQGQVVLASGEPVREAFVVDLPDDLRQPGDGPLAGTVTRRPFPPRGVRQRRLTHTAGRKYAGIQGPRHWLRSSPDGSQIAMLMRDDDGVVQLFTVPTIGGVLRQLTHNDHDVAAAFTWSPDGRSICLAMDGSICLTDCETGKTVRLTERATPDTAPRPEACVFSPSGERIAYVRPVASAAGTFNHIFVVESQFPGERKGSAP